MFVFLSVLFWSWLWGIAGAFVAVPLLLGLRAVSQRSRRLRLVRVYLDVDASAAPGVRALLGIEKRPGPGDAAARQRHP